MFFKQSAGEEGEQDEINEDAYNWEDLAYVEQLAAEYKGTESTREEMKITTSLLMPLKRTSSKVKL